MGKQSRKHRERRESRNGFSNGGDTDPDRTSRIGETEEKLRNLADGDVAFGRAQGCTADAWESHLEGVLAFESVGSGISLFEGLQQNGVDLPHPDRLNEYQSACKVMEVLHALEKLRIYLIGFDGMSAAKLYRALWSRTLWEECYVRKSNPFAITLIDVSHKMPKSEIRRFLEDLNKADSVH